jgi:signal transduction histidine kinase
MGERRRRPVATVRARVTAIAVVAVLVVLTIAGIGLVIVQRSVLRENVDEAVGGATDQIEAMVREDRVPDTLGGFGDDDTVAQVIDRDGRVVASTANAGRDDPVADPPPDDRRDVLRTIDDIPADDAPFRVQSRRVGDVIIHVGATLDDVEETTARLGGALLVAVPAVTAVLGAIVWLLVGRTLRPVEAIRAEVAGMAGTDLHRRVPEPAGDDEVARLARTMNAMLGRVEDAAERQRRFVADASHELRSPLTRIRTELEVDLAHPERADPHLTHRSALEETVGLQRLVDDLLYLARADAGAAVVERGAVDLRDVVVRCSERAANTRDVHVDLGRVERLEVRADAAALTRAVGNVIDNAVRHAATTVTVVARRDDGAVRLTVTDDGAGIPPGEEERIFERFTRLDASRTSATGGTGLGLAIARDIVERHGGTLVVDADHHGGAALVFRLPA